MELFIKAKEYCLKNLYQITKELEEWHNTGLLSSGSFRMFAKMLVDEAPSVADHKLQVAENIYNAIIRKWLLENMK